MANLFVLDTAGQTVTFGLLRLLGLLGGVAVGRSFAGSWLSPALMPLALALMSAAVQFVLFAVLGVDLLSLPGFLLGAVLVFAGGVYGYRAKRAEQMCRQYPWLFQPAGPVGWSDRA